ncbi:pentapeptide repeat-containing protein [Candidatus Saccharibacteria bacterium]|nr:pentapeptide repeat-containing protein [Candidatus Saccharibacteria bacterium]
MVKATKTIQELIEKPRREIENIHDDVGEDMVEHAGVTKQSFEIPAGKYRYIDISDCTFVDSFMNNVETFRSIVLRVSFTGAQMTGLQLAEGAVTDMVFKNCRMNLTNFRNAKFTRCTFTDCDLREADFGGCTFENVLFESCQLDEAEFSNAQSKRLEFEDCHLGSIKGVSGLRGALLDETNITELAPLFATDYNITVRE